MSMPGFTAASSIYGHGSSYFPGSSSDAASGEGGVEAAAIGCKTLLNRRIGPVSIKLRCCAIPPGCCITLSGFGLSRKFCIP